MLGELFVALLLGIMADTRLTILAHVQREKAFESSMVGGVWCLFPFRACIFTFMHRPMCACVYKLLHSQISCMHRYICGVRMYVYVCIL